MTVKELIEALKDQDEDQKIIIVDDSYYYYTIEGPNFVQEIGCVVLTQGKCLNV